MSENMETFRLINYQQRGNDAATLHTGLVLGNRIVPFEALAAYYPIAQKLLRACTSSTLTPGIEGLLANWEQSFNELSELAALVAQRLAEESLWQKESFALEEVHALSPVLRPTKMLFAGANYQQHVKQAEDWKEGINKSTPFFLFGNKAQKDQFLPPLARGEQLWSFGLTEPEADSDAGGTQTRAILQNGFWHINGSKAFIPNAGTDMTGGVTITAVTGTRADGHKEITKAHRLACLRIASGREVTPSKCGSMRKTLHTIFPPRRAPSRISSSRRAQVCV